MQITCWGSRGSIPVSGPKTMHYGGQTSCFAFQSTQAPKEMLVLDAGTGLYDLGQYLKTSPLQRIHLVFSHAHLDHVCGFPFFAPLFDSQYEIAIQAPSLPHEELASLIHGLLHPPLSPVTWNAVRARVRIVSPAEREQVVAGWHIETLPVCHPGEAVGFRCTDQSGHTAVVINDNELGAFTPQHWQGLVDFCAHADLLVHDGAREGGVCRGDALGEGNHVGCDVLRLYAEPVATAAEAGDHLVDEQQHVVLVTDLPDAGKVPLRGGVGAGGAADGLHHDGRDRVGTLVSDDELEVIGRFLAEFFGGVGVPGRAIRKRREEFHAAGGGGVGLERPGLGIAGEVIGEPAAEQPPAAVRCKLVPRPSEIQF